VSGFRYFFQMKKKVDVNTEC